MSAYSLNSASKLLVFVQNNLVEKLTAQVAQYAHARGLSIEDRSSNSMLQIDNCGIDWEQFDKVLVYGSVQFIRACKNSTIDKHILYTESDFSISSWFNVLGNNSLNGSGSVLSLAELSLKLKDAAFHVRPEFVDKAFAGGVYTAESWQSIVNERRLSQDLSCWVSPIKPIIAEFRCWVINYEVIEISQYRRNDKMNVIREESHEVLDEARRLAAIYSPASCYVIDIAQTEHGYKVIEFNPIHCSGWYAANIDKILDAWVTYLSV